MGCGTINHNFNIKEGYGVLDSFEFESGKVLENLKEISKIEGVFVRGLMTIPPICENNEKNRAYFKEMFNLFLDIQGKKIDNSNNEVIFNINEDENQIVLSKLRK